MFRVPQDHDGQGVVCPGCKIMLRLPHAEEDAGPLVIHRAEPKAHPEEEEEIDQDHEDHDDSHDEGAGAGKLIAMMAVPGVLLLGLFAWMLRPDPQAAVTGPKAEPTTSVAEGAPAVAGTEQDVPAKPGPSEKVQFETVAKGFLEAPTVEESLRWVLNPEKIRPKAEAWYARQPYQTPYFKGFTGETYALDQEGVRAQSLGVRIGSFDKRQLAMVKLPDGDFRVDWESWVGWSEMSWEDFKKQRSAEAKLFRVSSSPTAYYNFDFKDDSKWVSSRLDSPDKSDFLYGYAPVGSEVAAIMKPIDGAKEQLLIVKLKFPPDAKMDNQVIIEEVREGWLDLHPNP